MKLPVGLQDFAKIRKEGYVYVDKTEQIFNLLETSKYNFLSRPRRFGKSLLISTLHELYSGRKELFDDLWIVDKWDWKSRRHPVIWLRFSSLDYQSNGLEQAIHREILGIAESFGVELAEEDSLKNNFRVLIKTLAEQGQRVVLLVDEYDKPIIDYVEDVNKMKANKESLKKFYSILKDSDAYLEFVLITGVTAFSKVSLFSDLNNLTNLTLKPQAQTLVGISEAEIDKYLTPAINGVDREEMRSWYNGYSWGGPEKVYNPFSLLSYLNYRIIQNFWFETGTPTLLVKKMRDQRFYDIDEVTAGTNALTSFDIERISPIALLFQTGYLTVKEYIPTAGVCLLHYPNLEVKQALQQYLLDAYTESTTVDAASRVYALTKALKSGDLDKVIDILNAQFASLPYDMWKRDDEHFYHAILHLTFTLIGLQTWSEVHSANGRADMVVQTDNYVYVFEFKRDLPVAEALQQIEDRGYLNMYADDARTLIAVGISFNTENRTITDWKGVHQTPEGS